MLTVLRSARTGAADGWTLRDLILERTASVWTESSDGVIMDLGPLWIISLEMLMCRMCVTK